jgi:hypothetical protein
MAAPKVVTGCHAARASIGALRMALVSQREYARRRRISQTAVWKRTIVAGGPIPVHGPKKLIDVDEADSLWAATMSPQGMANARAAGAAKTEGPPTAVTGSTLAQARAAALVVEVQTKLLTLEQRRGSLISRDVAMLKAFATSAGAPGSGLAEWEAASEETAVDGSRWSVECQGDLGDGLAGFVATDGIGKVPGHGCQACCAVRVIRRRQRRAARVTGEACRQD